MTKSSVLLSPEDEKSIYFGQGHMRCLPHGNIDPIQVGPRISKLGKGDQNHVLNNVELFLVLLYLPCQVKEAWLFDKVQRIIVF